MNNSKNSLEIETNLDNTRFSIDELTVDLSAFLHFLLNQSENNTGEASYWALIPNSIDVKWEDDIEDFYLKKSLHNRKIYIYARRPQDENLKTKKKAELLNCFHGIIAENQINTVTLLLSKLKKPDIEKLKNNYSQYQQSIKKK